MTARRYDCGAFGRLTVCEIAARSGCHQETIRERLRAGWHGVELLRPPLPRNHQQNRTARPTAKHPWRRSNACETPRARWSSITYRARGKAACA